MLKKQFVIYTIFLFIKFSHELESIRITVKKGDSVSLECKLKAKSQFDFCEFDHEIKNKRLKCTGNEKIYQPKSHNNRILDKCEFKLENVTFKDVGRWRCHCGNTNTSRKNTELQNEIMLEVMHFSESEIIGII